MASTKRGAMVAPQCCSRKTRHREGPFGPQEPPREQPAEHQFGAPVGIARVSRSRRVCPPAIADVI
jgi:hypothetical protein